MLKWMLIGRRVVYLENGEIGTIVEVNEREDLLRIQWDDWEKNYPVWVSMKTIAKFYR